MIYEVMKSIRNFFPSGIYREGAFTVSDSAIALPFVKNGQYILIEGSSFNDGVYEYPVTGLTNEEFTGRITILIPPVAFLNVVRDIEAYEATATNSAFVSESFGGYTYTKATDGNGNVATWEDVFRKRLNLWRKI